MLSKNGRLFILSTFLVIVLIVEYIFGQSLYSKSMIMIKNIQQNHPNLIYTNTLISELITLKGIPVLLVLNFIIFPLSYSYSLFLILLFSLHFSSVLKIFFGEGRPYLDDISLFQDCETGNGKPSNHAFCTTSVYLALSQLLIDYFKTSKIKSIIIYIIAVILIIMVSFSRMILGAHSLNQVLFGDCLGFVVFYFVFQIKSLHKRDPIVFFYSFRNKDRIRNISIFFLILFLVSLFFRYFFARDNDPQVLKYIKVINELCPEKKPYQILQTDSFFDSLIIFGYIGIYYGMVTLVYLTFDDYIVNYEYINVYFNFTDNWYLKYIFSIGSFLPILIFNYFPGNVNLILVFIFKAIIPSFLTGYFLYGINIYLTIKFKGANLNIYKKTLPLDSDEYHLMGFEDNADTKKEN